MTKTKKSSITIRDVAREAGVSVATVSRYINQTAPVSEDVGARLQDIMQAMKFVPQATARNLATHKTHTIGLLLADISGDFFAPLLNGIEAITSQTGYDLLISCSRPAGRPVHPLPPLGPHNTDGILVFADSLDENGLEHYYSASFPMLLIHRTPPEGMAIPCVTVENKAASEKIVSHLIEVHQRRRIVFLKGPEGQEDSFWRESGYRQALAEHGLPFDPLLVAQGEFDRLVANTSIQKLLEHGVQFDAVFSGDDEAAVGVISALVEAGRKIPQDVSIIGFDDQRMSPYLSPPLTTVRAPTEEVGREAARQLIQIIQGKRPGSEITLLSTDLVLRRSCGCTS